MSETSSTNRPTGRARRDAAEAERVTLRRRWASILEQIRVVARDWAEVTRPYVAPAGSVLGCVSPFGWLVVAAAASSWVLGRYLGWLESSYAAVALAALFVLSCFLTIGRMALEVGVELEPQRVVVGDGAALRVRVRNLGRAPLLPAALDVPVQDSTIRFGLPLLSADETYEDIHVITTGRRGVFTVGPASTTRGDPFGLVRRVVTWTRPTDLFVHPRTTWLNTLGSGLLRDLEGTVTNDMSMNDLAFHTLREYAPGDDRRHIHWLSSAKRMASTGRDEFLVRQFVDTRRSHIGVVLDCSLASYVEEDSFELAVSVAASVARQAMLDQLGLTQAAGPQLQLRSGRRTALDLYAGAQLGSEPIDLTAARLAHAAPNVSAVVLVTGALGEYARLLRAKAAFSAAVNVVGVRVEGGARRSLQRAGGVPIVTVGSLADLRAALAGRFGS